MRIHTLVSLLGLSVIAGAIMFPSDSLYQQYPTKKARCSEHRLVFLALTVMLFMRVAYVFRYRIDSDEPQHLHVVWGWVHGLLQYRDVFDNHSPLFHLLCTPLLAALGERADVLLPMRLAMLPLYGLRGSPETDFDRRYGKREA